MTIPRILITPGEPAGIGPDLVIQIAERSWAAELIVIADPDLLFERAKSNIRLIETDLSYRTLHHPGTLKIVPIKTAAKVKAGELNSANADYVIQTLTLAAELSLKKEADALVTGPVQKSILNQAGIAFTGHTEFFAEMAKVPLTVMLFVIEKPAMKVALVTTHLPLKAVPEAITRDHLQSIIVILHQALQKQFGISDPHILICGLNPHAGEQGYLGREEIEVMLPVLLALREKGLSLSEPLPADTVFTPHYLKKADAVLAMYHDQALPLVKYAGFGHAVNMTLGLPFIRTSVDHGTALDLAGTGKADPGSLVAAIELAIRLTLI